MSWGPIYFLIDAAIFVLLLVIWRENQRVQGGKNQNQAELKELKEQERHLDKELKEVRDKLQYYKKHRPVV